MCKNIAGRINSDMSSLIGQKDWSTSRLYEILELAYSKVTHVVVGEGIPTPTLINCSRRTNGGALDL